MLTLLERRTGERELLISATKKLRGKELIKISRH
jgi:hypothetical protein